MGDARAIAPIHLMQWIDEHREALKPPVCNRQVFKSAEFIIMVVGGPNARKDYHYDEGEEFFYQLEGEMLLKTIQDGAPVDIPIRAGEILLLPPRVPHSPQRYPQSVGLVVERQRRPEERDGFLWYCDRCHHKLFEEYLHIDDIEAELPPVFQRFYASVEHRTCDRCGTVMEKP